MTDSSRPERGMADGAAEAGRRGEPLSSGERISSLPAQSDEDWGAATARADSAEELARLGTAPTSTSSVDHPAGVTTRGYGMPTGEPAVPSSRDLCGQVLDGKYTVLREIGRGGMSIVYLARHEVLNKTVAIKVLREEVADHKDSQARFLREARAAATIGEPHIVDITDYGSTPRGDAYIVMEHLSGHSLRATIVAEGPLPVGRAVAIARQILRGLAAAHARGIIHRDLKAENVILVEREGKDFVKLLDFGISKLLQPLGDQGISVTSTGQVLGTPQYLSPEQAHGTEEVDQRTDIYALGVLLYEMLTGGLPFTGKSVFELMLKHVQEAPQPLRERRPDLNIPEELERVVLKAISKRPADRYPSAEAMLEALPGSEDLPGGYSSQSMTPAPRPQSRQLRQFWIVLAVCLLASVAVIGIKWLQGPAPQERMRGDQHGVSSAWRSQPGPGPQERAGKGAHGSRRHPGGAATQPASAAHPATVTLEVQVEPTHAVILLEGKPIGTGQVKQKLPWGEQPLPLEVNAPGFEPKQMPITPKADLRLELALKRRPPAGAVKRASGRKRPANAPGDIKTENPYLRH